MMKNLIEIEFYVADNGKAPFISWLEKLDETDQIKIKKRLARIRDTGNLGDYKNLSDGVSELRFFFGSGYRIYFGKQGEKIIILLCGGNKSSQSKDIAKAKEGWKNFIKKNYN